MKVLYLVPHVPNPTKVRSYQQIRGLVDASHEVTVATLVRAKSDRDHVSRLQKLGVSVLTAPLGRRAMLINAAGALLRGQPLQARLLWSNALMHAILRELDTRPVDIIHVEHLRMTPYGLRLRDNWPVVWDAVDSLTSLFQQAIRASENRIWQLLAWIEAPRLKRFEPWLTTAFPATLVISPRDQALFQHASPVPDRVRLAPFGVPIPAAHAVAQRAGSTIVLTGSMNYHPNVGSARYFMRDVFPRVASRLPEARVQLVGANPPPTIQALRNDNVEVTGFVESVTEYLERATIAVAPMTYGSGLQIKVIEALLAGTPLVATPTALRGLELEDGQHVLIANDASAFADAVVRLLADPDLRDRLAQAGRRYVEEHHNLCKTTATLVGLYRQVIAGPA